MNGKTDGVHHFPGGRRFAWRCPLGQLENPGKSPTH